MTEIMIGVVCSILGILLGAFAVILYNYLRDKGRKQKSDNIVKDAQLKADMIIKNAQIDGKQVVLEFKNEAEKEYKVRRQELAETANKLSQREDNLDKRDLALISKETNLENKDATLNRAINENSKKEKILQEKIDSIIVELEKVSQLSHAQARDEILARVESKMDREVSIIMKNREEVAHDEAEEKAKLLLSLAISKHAQEITVDRTVSTISLPSEEMKGRIIGREGRNIKSLEQLLGVDILIDDTPEAITVSCFDPIRREIAKRTLDSLISDGRIQPGRIEEVASKMAAEVKKTIVEAGQEVCFKLGIGKMPREEVELLGRLKYRTSYGQNGLEHSYEVAELTGIMAAELGLDQNLAKRAGLLHDLGKALDFEIEGSHVEIGARMAKKFNEPEVVINAIESHHGDKEAKFIISHLVQAADALSAARPGARSETLEKYIKRIEQLEQITKSYDGVYQSYAMQSGREIRVMVLPDKIDDVGAYKMARDIRERIENEMNYPGQIKVSVIREYRAIETAK